jgi:hypothetical protein
MKISGVVPLATFFPLSLNAFILVPNIKNVYHTALSVDKAAGAIDGKRFTIPLEQLNINDILKVGGYGTHNGMSKHWKYRQFSYPIVV